MLDTFATARLISDNWPAIVGTLPDPLADAVDALDAARYAQPPHAGINPSGITAENAEESIIEYAVALSAEAKFDEAKLVVQRGLASRVVNEATEAVPALTESIRPEFDSRAAEYADAVAALPADISPKSLVAAGPAVLAEYQRAVAAEQYIRRVDAWVASLTNLPAFTGLRTPAEFRVLNPADQHQFGQLTAAAKDNPDAYGELSPLYVNAVRMGVEFYLHTPVEAAEVQQAIEKAAEDSFKRSHYSFN